MTLIIFVDDLLLFAKNDPLPIKLFLITSMAANLEKTKVCFGDITPNEQQHILDRIKVRKGSLPIRYLGDPLSSRKLIVAQLTLLIDKVIAHKTSGTIIFLSYSVRL